MLTNTYDLMNKARMGGYSVGAFNVYNLEEVRGVIVAAEELASPVILQMLPSAIDLVGVGLVKLCLAAAHEAQVPVAVHLDHCTSAETIRSALEAGLTSVMADGSHLNFEGNLAFTREMVTLAKRHGGVVEGELGRLTGCEEDWIVEAYEACLTDPAQAEEFVIQTGVAALAVCIGNVHGRYPSEPDLDFERLDAIGRRFSIPLVLHGTSGLPDGMIRRAIELGVCKFNVNTELREAYLSEASQYLSSEEAELTGLIRMVIQAVSKPVKEKISLFGSEGKAGN